MDAVLGERELSFNPMTGKFDAERDWGKTAIEKGAPDRCSGRSVPW